MAISVGSPSTPLEPGSLIKLSLLLLLTLQLLSTSHYRENTSLWFDTLWQSGSERQHGISLSKYQVDIEAKPIETVEFNLSGLAADNDREILWAVTNDPTELIALDHDGNILSRHKLHGFHDVEAVAYLGNGRLMVAEERRQSLTVIPTEKLSGLKGNSAEIERNDMHTFTLALGANNENKGYEGLAYDIEGDRLYIGRENAPEQLIVITGIAQTLDGDFSIRIDHLVNKLSSYSMPKDVSSVDYDSRSHDLVILSDESKRVMEMTDKGELMEHLPLEKGNAGLHTAIPQAEGIALDSAGNLYILSEPNLFYRFKH